MSEGDLVIYARDPLLFGGELLILKVRPDGRFYCEQVNYVPHSDGDVPPRGVFNRDELEIACVWAKQPV